MARRRKTRNSDKGVWRLVLATAGLLLSLVLSLVIAVVLRNGGDLPPAPPPPTTTPPPPTSTSTTAPAADDVLQDALEELTRGRILFNPPRTTRLGTTERIEARITRTESEDIARDLRGAGPPTITPLQEVSPYMSVELSGSAFTITPLSETDQPVGARGFAPWEWDVTSRRSGTQKLRLHVSMRIPVQDRADERRSIPVLERTIEVKVNTGYSLRQFWEKNWQWLLGFLTPLLLGGAGLLWRRSERRRQHATIGRSQGKE